MNAENWNGKVSSQTEFQNNKDWNEQPQLISLTGNRLTDRIPKQQGLKLAIFIVLAFFSALTDRIPKQQGLKLRNRKSILCHA